MRLFLALDLPGEMRDRVAGVLARLQGSLSGWRFVGAEGLHVTLRFLGEVDESIEGRGRDAWRECAGRTGPFRLRLAGIGTFPEGRRARVLWLGASEAPPEGRLAVLAASLESAARSLGLAPETRPFHAHVTLARASDRPADVPARDREVLLGEIEAREVVLFRSRLGRGGARYEALATFPLGAGPASSAIVPPGRWS